MAVSLVSWSPWGENEDIFHNGYDGTDVIGSHDKLALGYVDKFMSGYVGKCVLDSGTRQDDRHHWPAHRWPPGHGDPGFRPV